MRKLAIYLLCITALTITALPATTLSAIAQNNTQRTPNTPTPDFTPLIGPLFEIIVTPRTPADPQPDATPQSTTPTRQTNPQPAPEPVYRDNIPLPMARPIYVEGIPAPQPRPLLTLDRPALLDAETRENIIVTLIETGPDKPDAETIAKEFGLELEQSEPLALLDIAMVRLRVPADESVDDIVTRMIADARIFAAQPNYVFTLQQSQSTEKATLFDLQYAPQRMKIDRAHEISRGGETIIAVIDTGADLTHPAFSTTDFEQFNAVDKPATAAEPHGTAIAGLIAAKNDLMGIAPEAKLLLARAFAQTTDDRFLSDSFTLAKAIDWATSQNAQIINMSFAGPADPLLLKLIDALAEREILVVAAAGNNGIDAPPAYPAAHPKTIAVTATDQNDALYTSANRGIYVTVAAPGVDVLTPAPNNTYELSSGTSIATAHMSGILALLLSQSPGMSRTDLVAVLNQTADDTGAPGHDPEFGHGLVDAFKAASAMPHTPSAQ